MVSEKRYRPRAPILLYHRFDTAGPVTPWTIEPALFETQLRWLAENGYRVVPLRSVIDEVLGTGPALESGAVAITVDDGDRTVHTEMFPLIQRHAVPVSLFVNPFSISRSAAAVTWEQLEEMVGSGLVDVQCHTLTHPDFTHERKYRSTADFRALVEFELTQSRDAIEKRLNVAVDLLAWPYGFYDEELERAAVRAGYAAAFAVEDKTPERISLFAIPRLEVANRDPDGERFRKLVGPIEPPVPEDRPAITTPTADFNAAYVLHQRGQLAEAERLYGSILSAQPDHFDARHLLGVVYLQRNHFEAAERQIGLAIEINPDVASAHNNRGNALRKLKRLNDALASYDRAIALRPNYPEAFNNRGNILKALGWPGDALASYDKAIALKPDYSEAIGNRQILLQDNPALKTAAQSILTEPG
jgi:tetratricopeptide (TPR) repeat protein